MSLMVWWVPSEVCPNKCSLSFGGMASWYPWYGRLYRRNLSASRLLCHFSLTNTDLRSLYWSNKCTSWFCSTVLVLAAGQRHSILSPSQIFRASPSFGLSSYHFLPGNSAYLASALEWDYYNAMVAAVQVNVSIISQCSLTVIQAENLQLNHRFRSDLPLNTLLNRFDQVEIWLSNWN